MFERALASGASGLSERLDVICFGGGRSGCLRASAAIVEPSAGSSPELHPVFLGNLV